MIDGEIIARYPDIPIWVKRVGRNEKLISELNEQADKFIEEMYQVIQKIKNLK